MSFNPTALPTSLDAVHLGLALLALLLLVLCLVGRGRRGDQAPAAAPAEVADKKAASASSLRTSSPDAALQLLALLQQEARLIDFLQEDLGGYSDADVGAAARVVHEGGRKVLDEYFSLAPLRSEEEESRLTIAEGFNPAEIKLTGNVVGAAPFTGKLVHRGWKVSEVKLPRTAEGHDLAIVAPAEVEL